jgi:glycosyltransferase involved in cell wall biosynthesis
MISACILTRNSARTIRECIESIRPAVDEVVVVDTGSYDETLSIVASLGLTAHHFDWVHSFSAARNYAHSRASNDWIIAVDSDEILYREDVNKIRAVIFDAEETAVFSIAQINTHQDGDVHAAYGTARLYNRRHMSWRYRAHEQLAFDGSEAVQSRRTDIRFRHDGYDGQMVSLYDKRMRNVKLLREDVNNFPNSWDRHFFLGRDTIAIANNEEAIQHLQIACRLLEFNDIHLKVPSAYRALANAYEVSGLYEEAQSVTQKMVEWFPHYPDGYYMHARLHVRQIEKLLRQAKLHTDLARRLAQSYTDIEETDESIGTWKGDMTLGDLAKLSGDLVTARNMYQSALESGGPTQPLSDAIRRINTMLRST